MSQPIHIKTVTDAVFSLCEPLYLQIDAFSSTHQEMFSIENPSGMQNQEQAIMDAFSEITRPMLNKQLQTIVPEALFWWKGESRPESEYTWVVSPAVYRFMRCSYTSIALLHRDSLLLGVHLNCLGPTITTGEKGDGASTFEEIHIVNDRPLPENAAYTVHHRPEVKVFPDMAQYQRLRKFTGGLSSRPAYNNVIENLAGSLNKVAANQLHFVMGTQFSFPDVAAAICVAESAGCVVSDFSGTNRKLLNGEELFCSNPKIHEQFMMAL